MEKHMKLPQTINHPQQDKTQINQIEFWREKFAAVPLKIKVAVGKLDITRKSPFNSCRSRWHKVKNRILLTLATGTGKTAIAFQIAWKLFQTRWNYLPMALTIMLEDQNFCF